ncbi:MAG: hypothetical protein FKY71_14755 [Spiribacter salinus]|uniref:TrfA family protein n=1 Tax=Spiribacter salinus TaxID=1335746 RepID=A0A540VNF4_9GAMM|nr:MAG: hypothetical protein FKY71_14755 [Spiribacter salinus]
MSMMKPVSGLVAKIEALQEQARLRSDREERDPTPDAVISNNVVKLPLWPEEVRAVPNSFLRSALFGAIRKGRRRYLEAEQIAAIDGIEVRYTGQRLDQGDLDVWEALLHAVRDQDLGSECRATSYALLKLMGKTDTGKNRKTLQTRIERLRANAIRLKQGRHVYIGGLVDEAYKDEETQEWVIVLNPRLRALYGPDQFTQIEWAVRQELGGQQLAQWLHGFYASHAKPFPVKIETLHQLCGSEAVLMSDFAKKLRKALGALSEASAAQGASFNYQIREGLVHVEKAGSSAQRRHLARKR